MSIAKGTAIYIVQALFWLWLAREAVRDRPRDARRNGPARSLAERMWRLDANVTQSFCWTALFVTTIAFTLWLVNAVRQR